MQTDGGTVIATKGGGQWPGGQRKCATGSHQKIEVKQCPMDWEVHGHPPVQLCKRETTTLFLTCNKVQTDCHVAMKNHCNNSSWAMRGEEVHRLHRSTV